MTKVWVWIAQSEDWEQIAECPIKWGAWVTVSLQRAEPDLIFQYGTEKPTLPFRLDGSR